MRAPYVREFAASLEAAGEIAGVAFDLIKTASGGLDFVCGGGAVLFGAVTKDGRRVRIKCYREHDPRRSELYSALESLPAQPYGVVGHYVEHGLAVVCDDRVVECDVLVVPEQEGVTLDRAAAELCREGRGEALSALAENWDKLVWWLMSMPWAHGDLKPDNVIVTPEGLRLVDFDAAWVEGMTTPRTEIGSADYNHPLRSHTMESKHVDDWGAALISLNLHLLAADPSLMHSGEFPVRAEQVVSGCFIKQIRCCTSNLNPILYTLTKILSESSFPEIEGLAAVFAPAVPFDASRVEPFNVASRWGLRCCTTIVRPAVWCDIVARDGVWYGIIEGRRVPL